MQQMFTQYATNYSSPLGEIVLTASETHLLGITFDTQELLFTKHNDMPPKAQTIFKETSYWLDIYFSGKKPNFTPPLKLIGTPFQISVWRLLQDIPYGQVTTYGTIATILARQMNISKMSAQAVGQAVGKNKIAIIIPCHRVIGQNGSLTGYAGGIDKKIRLLGIEKYDTSNLVYSHNKNKKL